MIIRQRQHRSTWLRCCADGNVSIDYRAPELEPEPLGDPGLDAGGDP